MLLFVTIPNQMGLNIILASLQYRRIDLSIYLIIYLSIYISIYLFIYLSIYKPNKKPNDCINYIHKESNHPPAIINNLPKGIELRLSNNSSDSKLFGEAANPYNRALKDNGHRKELKFTTSPKPTDMTNHDPKDPRHNEPKKKDKKEKHHLVQSSFQ